MDRSNIVDVIESEKLNGHSSNGSTIIDIPFCKFKNVYDETPIMTSFLNEMDLMKNGYYRPSTLKAQNILKEKGKKSYTIFKENNVEALMPGLQKTGESKDIYSSTDFTPIIVFDIDDKKEDPEINKNIIQNNCPWVIGIGKSIGGNGLWVMGKCDPFLKEESYESAITFLKKFGVTVSKSQGNPNRLRFPSHDPNLWFNPNPLSAPNIPIVSTSKSKKEKSKTSSPKNWDGMFSRIVEIRKGISGEDFLMDGNRHNSLLPIIAWVNRNGLPIDECVTLTEKYCLPLMENAHDFDIESEVKSIYHSYEDQFSTYEWDDETPWIDGQFWSFKDDKITIYHSGILRFLSNNGFSLHYLDATKMSFIFIQRTNNLIEEKTTTMVGQFIKDWINQLPGDNDGLYESFCRGITVYTSKSLLSLLPIVELDFLKDTKECAYFPFINGIVEVYSNGVKLIPYENQLKVIWKNKIIDFKINIDEDSAPGEFQKFISLVTNKNETRFLHGKSVIGYLLHRYKNPSQPFAIIFAEETEDDNSGGGTGKGICMHGIGKMRTVVTMNGRADSNDKSFRWQRVNLDTDIICIEECKRNYDFASLNNAITDGIPIEKKNKLEFFIAPEDAPKFALTTNFTIDDSANHAKRRQKVMEFSKHFSPTHTPQDEFGHLLFMDWDEVEWNRFYQFMFGCVKLYLNDGVHDMGKSISLCKKQIRQEYGEELLEWWIEYSESEMSSILSPIATLYDEFLLKESSSFSELSLKGFSQGLEKCCELFGFKYFKKRKSNGGAIEVKCTRIGEEDYGF